LKIKGQDNHFIVCVQADHARRPWAQYHIVQNKNQLFGNTSYIPHWVQPGLIKRDAGREGVTRVAYSGQTYNKNLAGSEDTWKNLLEPYGIEFITLSNDSWHDLSSIDVLIGIRSFNAKPHNTKPPSKLFNAWHAEIPFIGGNDSAYKQVGNPGEDYLIASSQEEAITAILQLQQDPDLYRKFVKNGRKKAALYTEATIAKIWLDVLTGPITRRYQHWQIKPFAEKMRFNSLLAISILKHQLKQVVKKVIGKKKINLVGGLGPF
jgi:hypothetical protein